MARRATRKASWSKTATTAAAAECHSGAVDALVRGPEIADDGAAVGAILEQVSDVVLLLDAAGCIVYASPAVERTFGHATAALKGLHVGRLVPALEALNAERVAAAVIEAAPQSEAAAHGAEFTGLTDGGAAVPLQARVTWLRVGGTPHLLLTLRDIRARVRVRDELHQLRGYMTQIVEGAGEAIVSTDSELRIILFNHGAEQVFGHAAEDVLGRHLDVLLPKRFRGHHAKYVKQFAEGHEDTRLMGQRGIITGVRKDGEEFPAETSIMKFEHCGRTVFTAVLRDVSDRHALDQALRDSERRFRAVFNESCQFAALLTREGRIVEVNEPALDFAGTNVADVRGKPLWEAACGPSSRDARARLRFGVERATAGELVRYTDAATWADGERHTFDVSVKPVRDEAGEVALLLVESRDITDLVQTYEALRTSEERLADAQRIAQLGNWEWHLESGELHWSDEVYRIFGLPHDRFGATYEAFLDRVHPDDRPTVCEAVNAALEHGTPYAIDHRIVRPDGTERIVHEHAEVQRDENGRPVVMAGTVQDITERKEREQALARAKEEAETASRAKSQFLATMSHELRTPLNAIIGFAEVLEGEIFGALGGERYREYSRHIRESGQHLLSIVNDILDVAKVESGRVHLQDELLDIGRLATAALRLVCEQSTQAEVELEQAVPRDLPALRGDERLLKQMLTNLLSNAVKFTHAGGTVSVGADITDSGELEIRVADTGIGIPPEHLDTVLDPFVQGDNSLARRYAGTGLGLPLVRAFVELHGGTVKLDSEVDVGTVARLTFPAERIVAWPEPRRTGTGA